MEALPEAFVKRIQDTYPFADQLIQSLDGDVPVSIQLHPTKSYQFDGKNIPWSDRGVYLPSRPQYTLDPLLHGGAFYPQEASSMFLNHVLSSLDLEDAEIVCDLCAAPGGKSLVLHSFFQNRALVVSNEIIPKRNAILRENLIKWGFSSKVITQSDPAKFGDLPPMFDLLVIDAPCSGEGMFRKDERARQEWSEENVALCAKRQSAILDDALPSLKDGGYLVYSTCTFAQAENEDQVNRLVDSGEFEVVNVEVDPAWNIHQPMDGCFQFFPHRTEGEGLFMAVLRKTGMPKGFRYPKSLPRSVTPPQQIELPEDFVLIEMEGLRALPKAALPFVETLRKKLYIKALGTEVGEAVKHKFIPSHELALSCDIQHNLPTLKVDRDTALAFLRKEKQRLDEPQGWYQITHQGVGLGWVKALGNRVNNYYPKAWRVLIERR